MPDAYFDSNLNGNLTASLGLKDNNAGNVEFYADLLAINSTQYIFDGNLNTNIQNSFGIKNYDAGNVEFYVDLLAINSTQYSFDSNLNGSLTDTLGIEVHAASLPYTVTRSPTLQSRFLD